MTETVQFHNLPRDKGRVGIREEKKGTQCEPDRYAVACQRVCATNSERVAQCCAVPVYLHQRRISCLTQPQERRHVLFFIFIFILIFAPGKLPFADGDDCCNQQETFPALSLMVLTERWHPFGLVGCILSALGQGSSPVAARSTLGSGHASLDWQNFSLSLLG